jgi:hypothetical protein
LPRILVLAATLALCACVPSTGLAVPTARMSAALTPEHLGAPTRISARFRISWSERRPPVLTAVSLEYPHNLGFATSGLGLAACDPTLLAENGPEVCPANSYMGGGDALVEIPLGGFLHQEAVRLTLVAGPSPNGVLHVLVAAIGSFPVSAVEVLSSELLPRALQITVPPIPTLPEGPYVSLVHMHLVLGGALTYYERRRGKNVPYHPPGIGLPRTCPRGGFAFAATFSFLGGQRARAHTTVPCPRRPRWR